MSARLTLTMNGATLAEIRAWCDRAEKLGVNPRDPVVFADKQGRLAIPVSARRILLPPAPAAGPTETMRRARKPRH